MGSESLAFKDWARNEGLHSFGSLRLLKESTVAIDAEDYLNTLLIQARTREPLLPALGGLPFALEQHIDSDLANFYDADIKPIFVFPGLDVACKDRRSISRESQKAIKILDDAWTVYDQGRGDDAVVAFGKACKLSPAHPGVGTALTNSRYLPHATYHAVFPNLCSFQRNPYSSCAVQCGSANSGHEKRRSGP